ncbi:extracellular solute-binding protein [Patescibacteria group bacterium]
MKQKYFYKLIPICLLIAVSLMFTGLECPPREKGQEEEISLEWWRVNFDNNDDLQALVSSFEQEWPNITVNVRTFTFSEYENEVVDAISASTAEENKGPDILSIHDDWLPRWQDRLLPMPESTEVFEHMSFRNYADDFVETAVDELTTEQQIYAIPLYIDTLALYYNKDLLDSAGVTRPPSNWAGFSDAVEKLTVIADGEIIQSGAAIGTSTNINRSTDILEMLMLQNGAKMINEDHDRITFNSSIAGPAGNQINPGLIATTFYTDFANAQKEVYTWNPSQDYSIDAFVAGKTAMMFNYSFRQETLETKSPNLNYGIATVPQVDLINNSVAYPNYWAEAVSNKTLHPHEAWSFVEHLGKYDVQLQYLELTEHPPARRDIIEEVKNEPITGIFAEQSLIARSWWKPDSGQTEVIFAKMIESINLGRSTVQEAMNVAQQSMQQLIKED